MIAQPIGNENQIEDAPGRFKNPQGYWISTDQCVLCSQDEISFPDGRQSGSNSANLATGCRVHGLCLRFSRNEPNDRDPVSHAVRESGLHEC